MQQRYWFFVVLTLCCASSRTSFAFGDSGVSLDAATRDASVATGSTARAHPVAGAPQIVGNAREIAAISAMQAVVRDGVLFVVSADTLSVSATSLATQQELWRTPVRTGPAGLTELTVTSATRLLVHAGNTLLSLDRGSGRVLARHAVRWNSGSQRAHIWQSRGACAIVGDCYFQPIECALGTPLGPALDGPEMTIHDSFNSDSSTMCLMHEHQVIGVTERAVLFAVSANAFESRADGTVLVARSLNTGRELFRNPLAANSVGYSVMGMSADRRRVFYSYRAPNQRITVLVHDAQTGARLWEYLSPNAQPNAQPLMMINTTSAFGLLLHHPSGAYEYWHLDLQRRRVQWRSQGGDRVLVLPSTALLEDEDIIRLGNYQQISWFSEGTGQRVSQLAVPEGQFLRPSVQGTGYEISTEPLGWDSNGALMQRSAQPMVFDVIRGSSVPPVHGAQVYVRQSALPVAELAEDGWWLGETRAANRVISAVFEWRRTGPATVHLYSAEVTAPGSQVPNATGRQPH